MHDEAYFLEAVRSNPLDVQLRLVYADWLEEQGDADSSARSEFLRMTARLMVPPPKEKGLGRERRKRDREWKQRLRELAASLDTDWLAIVSHLQVENCGQRRTEHPLHFRFLCDRPWEGMQTTEDPTVRFCEGCQQSVYYCDTIVTARQHAGANHCIAIDSALVRRDGDLFPPEERVIRGLVSLMDYPSLNREMSEPDPVSVVRELRKAQRTPGASPDSPASPP